MKLKFCWKWKVVPWLQKKPRVKGVFVRQPKTPRLVVARKICRQILEDWLLLVMTLLTSSLWMLTAAGIAILAYLGADQMLGLFVGEELVRIGLSSAVAAVTLYWARREFFRVWGQDDSMAPEQQPPAAGRRE